MSLHTYTVPVLANGDLGQPVRDDHIIVGWNDSDFQAWNNGLATPFVLSTRQQAVLACKLALKNGTWSNVTAAQKDTALQAMIDRVFPEFS